MSRRIEVELIGTDRSLGRTFAKSEKDAKKFSLAMTGVVRSTGGFSRGFLSGAGALSSFGGALALTSGAFFAGAGIVAGLKAAVSAAGDFQQKMNVLQQVTGATAAEMAAVSLEARRLGADISLPATSASDAAEAMLQLSKGGLTLRDAMAAARGTLQLAAAAQTDVATAANTSARAITAFGLSGKDAGKIADALANAANAATGDINDFAIALSQSATSGHAFGLTAQDTVTALTELAQAGLVGSDAGTSLRVMLTRLLPTSVAAKREMKALGVAVTDAKGQFLPFRDVIENYSTSLSKLTPKQRQHALQVIFGTDAQRAANIIFGKSVSVFDNYERAVTKSGGAARAAAAQQKGFKGAVDGFNSALQTTAVTVGTTLLPTLTKYLRQAATWLGDSRNQEKIQKEVTKAVELTIGAIKILSGAVKTIDKVTGSFKNTLELLLALKVAKTIVGLIGPAGRATTAIAELAGAFRTLKKAQEAEASAKLVTNVSAYTGAAEGAAGATGNLANQSKKAAREAKVAAARVEALRLAMKKLAAIGIVAVAVEVVIHRKSLDDFERKVTGAFTRAQQGGFTDALAKTEANIANLVPGVHVDWHSLTKAIDDQTKKHPPVLHPSVKVEPQISNANQVADFLAKTPGFFGAVPERLGPPIPSLGGSGGGGAGGPEVKLTAEQRNTFFDNQIARILLRGGLGSINQQIAALQQANTEIAARIKATKDVTRKLNLEDELMQNQAQITSLRTQAAAEALSKRQDKFAEFIAGLRLGVTRAQATSGLNDDLKSLKALEDGIRKEIKAFGRTAELTGQLFDTQQQIKDARQRQADAKQFFTLGLGPTGDDRVPLVKALRKQLSNVSASVEGSFLDTNKTRSVLSNIKKVLSAGVGNVSSEVRAKIKEMLDGIDGQLGDHARNLTKFAHVNSAALVNALGLKLSASDKKRLQAAFDQIGAGGTVPGGRSTALAGVGTISFTHTTVVDGAKVERSVTKVQRRKGARRTESRRGPYAGRN
jgi:TP901 family phage tail tape measure protein